MSDRKPIKSVSSVWSAQARNKRREEFLEQAARARRDLTRDLRKAAVLEEEMQIDEKKQRKKDSDLKYANILTIPEYMLAVPQDLKVNWMIMPRPEGIRCFVISCNGMTISRKRNGKILSKFQSMLPDGSL